MRNWLDQLSLQPSSYNKPQSSAGWKVYEGNLLVGCQHQQTLCPLVFPTNQLLQHRDVPVFLPGHLFSHKKCGMGRDVITKSEAPKEKSEEAKEKTIIKITFLLIKIHVFIFQE